VRVLDPRLKAKFPSLQPPTAPGATTPTDPVVDPNAANSGFREQPTEYDRATPGTRADTGQPPPAPPAQAPPGYDPEKWANQEHQTPKYKVTRILTSFGDLRDEGNRNRAIQALMEAEPGTQYNGKDKIMLPGSGEGRGVWIDVFGNASGGEYRPQWIDTSYEEGGANYVPPAGGSGGFLPPAAPAGGAGGSWSSGQQAGAGWGMTSSQSSSTLADNPNRKAYQDRIAELLETPLTVNAEDLANTPQAQAAAMTRQRMEERTRGQLMERAAQDGYSGGAVDAELNGIRQNLGEHEIGMMAELATQKMMENRDRVLTGIQFAQADNNTEMEQQLRRELANLDAAIQRESIAAGLTDNAADRGLRRELGLLGIGYNYDALQAQMNQAATLALLDGY
jgi:hypothetical protein